MNINAKVIRRGATAIAVAAAVGALGACSTGQSGNAMPTPQGAGGVGAAVSAAPNGGTGQGADTEGAARTKAAARTQSAKNASGHPNCTNLKVTDTSPDLVNGSNTQWKLPITLTNQSSAPCVVQGFPGVRLVGEDGTTWDLVRTNVAGTPVLLGPGDHATADLTYTTAAAVAEGSGSGWHVSSMAVTPPDGTNTQTLPWPDSLDLVKQDAATHPGTYIGPVHPGTAG